MPNVARVRRLTPQVVSAYRELPSDIALPWRLLVAGRLLPRWCHCRRSEYARRRSRARTSGCSVCDTSSATRCGTTASRGFGGRSGANPNVAVHLGAASAPQLWHSGSAPLGHKSRGGAIRVPNAPFAHRFAPERRLPRYRGARDSRPRGHRVWSRAGPQAQGVHQFDVMTTPPSSAAVANPRPDARSVLLRAIAGAQEEGVDSSAPSSRIRDGSVLTIQRRRRELGG